jgi:hypothetical protein
MSTIGATDGSIIAAIIVTQIPTYQPSAPRSVPGPASMPRMRETVTIHVTSAAASRSELTLSGFSRPSVRDCARELNRQDATAPDRVEQ